MEIAVISGKGGTGKSSICSAFISIAGSAVAVDCDVDASNLHLLFTPTKDEETIFESGSYAAIDYDKCTNCGVCADLCRFDAIGYENGRVTIAETGCDGCYLCARACPNQAISMHIADKSRMYAGTYRYGDMVYGRLSPGEENSGKLVNLLRDKAKKCADKSGCQTIILDGPPGIGCPVISTITGVDRVVVVTEPTMSGFLDMQRVIDVVNKFTIRLYVIVNKCDLNKSMGKKIDKWCKERSIPIIAHLPFDSEIVDAMLAGKTIVEHNKESHIAHLIEDAYNLIVNDSCI